ncbi:hypothetical protein N9021_02850 [Akkermansiaceae bacterium]|nr:hypothetical protein [Akkermansiaceae bacterium]
MFIGTKGFFAKGLLLCGSLLSCCPSLASENVSEDATGLEVNRFSRNEVVAFWHRYYMASEGYEERWSGEIDVTNCTITAPPAEFTKDVQRRVNYYRAMAGLSGDISFEDGEIFRLEADLYDPPAGTMKSDAARAAAMIFGTQEFDPAVGALQLTHDLDPSWDCFTPRAWNGAMYSNLAALFWGPGAIDAYMDEPGDGDDPLSNRFVGHRRWILFTAAVHMSTGDVPSIIEGEELVQPGANALYVIGDFSSDRQEQFVAWPNNGFSPAPALTKLWSLSYPGADFSEATVTMKGPDGIVPLEVVSRSRGVPFSRVSDTPDSGSIDSTDEVNQEGDVSSSTGPGFGDYADATIVWQPQGIPTDFSDDITYTITVENIFGGGPTSHSYSVTLIDPNVLVDLELTGSEEPPVGGASFYFGKVASADEFEFEISQRATFDEIEGGESSPSIVDNTHAGYEIVDSHSWSSVTPNSDFFLGTKSFRLAFWNLNNPDQDFELDQSLSTAVGATMTYNYRRGLMTSRSHLDTEISTDGGVSWSKVGSRISGVDNFIDGDFIAETVALPSSSALRIRFRKVWERDGPIGFNHLAQVDTGGDPVELTFPIGIFIDDISFTNTEIATVPISVIIPAGSQQAIFDSQALGRELDAGDVYSIRVRPRIANFAFAWSPVKEVTAQATSPLENFERWAEFTYPTAGGFHHDFDKDGLPNGLEYALGTSPIDPAEGLASFGLAQEGDRLCLSVPADSMVPGVTYSAEWSRDLNNWSSEGVTVGHEDGQIKAFAPTGHIGSGSVRWVITQE